MLEDCFRRSYEGFHEIHENSVINVATNETYIFLIPKKTKFVQNWGF